MGTAQWRWLAGQLAEPADFRIIASSIQVIADPRGLDGWGNYPAERERLLSLIGEAGADRVLILSGTGLYAEASITVAAGKPLLEFTCSGPAPVDLDHTMVPNPYRVAGPYVAEHFGLLEIDWDIAGSYGVTFNVIGPDGLPALRYRLGEVYEGREPPTRLERVEVPVDNTRLDLRQGVFRRDEVRPYNQPPRDRYGKDFPRSQAR